jgi:hypothetical protein
MHAWQGASCMSEWGVSNQICVWLLSRLGWLAVGRALLFAAAERYYLGDRGAHM